MDNENIEQEVFNLVREVSMTEFSIFEIRELNFFAYGIMSSLLVVHLIVRLEELFSIEISFENISMKNFESLEAIVSLVKEIQSGNS